MRELDREAVELEKQLAQLEASYLDRARVRKAENKPVCLPRLEPLLDVHASHLRQSQAAARRNSLDVMNAQIPGALSLSSPIAHDREREEKEKEKEKEEEKKKDKGRKDASPAAAKAAKAAGGASCVSPAAASTFDSAPSSGNATQSKDKDKDKEKDVEGAQMIANIANLRSRIRSRLSQKTSTAINLSAVLGKFQSKLNSDLAFFETSLRSCGDFAQTSGAQPGSDVAMRPSESSDEMILGKVIVYYADLGAYDVADVDNSKRYHLSESLVTVLDQVDITNKRLSKGEVVYAVYPETTAFYLASVSQAPRRVQPGMEATALVQFQGDSDEQGITPVVVVLLRHCFRAFV